MDTSFNSDQPKIQLEEIEVVTFEVDPVTQAYTAQQRYVGLDPTPNSRCFVCDPY